MHSMACVCAAYCRHTCVMHVVLCVGLVFFIVFNHQSMRVSCVCPCRAIRVMGRLID